MCHGVRRQEAYLIIRGQMLGKRKAEVVRGGQDLATLFESIFNLGGNEESSDCDVLGVG